MPSSIGIVASGFFGTSPYLRASASNLAVAAATTSFSVNVPAGTINGDFMLAHVICGDTITAPSGWTLLESGSSVHHFVYTRVASSEPASYTWTKTGTTLKTSVVVSSWGKCSGVDVHNNRTQSPASTTITWNSATTTVANTIAVHSVFATNAITFANPSPSDAAVNILYDSTNTGVRGTVSYENGPVIAGAYVSKNSTGATNTTWQTILLMLKP